MDKQKKILLIALPVVAVLELLAIVLVALNIVSFVIFISLFSILTILLVVGIFLLIKVNKKIKLLKAKQSKEEKKGNPLVDIYEALGIPIQYNPDGTIKDIYELLGIEPEFDENGNRKLTIYEQLGILPRFNSEGKEIPSVVVIKNRVNRIAKVDLSQRVLVRKETEAEKEERLIRETLKTKIEEAEKQGDTQKAEAIKKALASKKQSKPQQKKKAESKGADKPKYAMGKAAKPLKGSKIDKVPKTFNPQDIMGLFAFSAEKSKPQKPVPKPEAPKPTAVADKPKPTIAPEKRKNLGVSVIEIKTEKQAKTANQDLVDITTEEMNL